MANNKSRNKSYTKEFKDSVLKRLEQNETVGSLADELDISKPPFTNGLEHIMRSKRITQST